MATLTPNYNLILPAINDPTDQDLWGGMLNSNFVTLDTVIHDIAIKEYYPVGSLYFNANVSTNPATLLGFGTWQAYGEGKVIMGVGSNTDSRGETRTFTLNQTLGAYQHQVTEQQMPSHYHLDGSGVNEAFQAAFGFTDTGSETNLFQIRGNKTNRKARTSVSGGNQPHNNIQPSIAVYIWRRTA